MEDRDKHAAQWQATLSTYASPVFGKLPVSAIDTGMVMRVLEPIWSSKNETAHRVRGRIESGLSWAKVRGYRSGENPAQWRNHLDHLLPAPSKVHKVEHHAALPYDEMPAFMRDLRERYGVAALALEFAILTATRTSETLNAAWTEFDLDNRLWTIPAERMKADREHRVPLCDRAVAIVQEMQTVRNGDFVFPGAKRGKPLSNMAMLTTLRRMERGDLTTHGFRATFKTWATEKTDLPARGDRSCAGARHRRQGRSGVPARRSAGEAAAADGRMGRVLRQPRRQRQRGRVPMTKRKTTPHLKRGPKPKPKPPKRSRGRPTMPLREHPDRYMLARFDVADWWLRHM